MKRLPENGLQQNSSCRIDRPNTRRFNFQLQAAKAAQLNAKPAIDSELGGVDTTVAQIQLENAKRELDQTTIRAPSNGYVIVSLTVGDRAPCKLGR